MFIVSLIVFDYCGLKAQCLYIAQGKRSGTLGNYTSSSPQRPIRAKVQNRMPFCLVCMIDIILLPFDILSTSSLHGITKASLVLLLLCSSVQGVYRYYISNYPRRRDACLGLWTFHACSFRASLSFVLFSITSLLSVASSSHTKLEYVYIKWAMLLQYRPFFLSLSL